METTDAPGYQTTALIPRVAVRLYQYECARCGHTIEEFRASRMRNVSPWCLQCAGRGARVPMRRVITPPAIRGETVSRP